jgi:hypothetical protein
VKLWNLSYFLAVVACGLMEFVIYFFSSKFVNFFSSDCRLWLWDDGICQCFAMD